VSAFMQIAPLLQVLANAGDFVPLEAASAV
jgi:hypothetical protein